MKFFKDFSSENHIKLLVYGDSGVGKTCFAAMFPGPIAFLDFDNKLSSAFNLLRATNADKINQIAFESFSTNRVAQEPYKRFHGVLSELEALVAAGKFNYKTIVLDSLTLYSEAMMNDIIKSHPQIKRAIAGHPSMNDYGLANTHFSADIGRLLSLPCNVVCIGHIKEVTDEKTGDTSQTVMLTGKLAKYAPTIFREQYRAFARTEKDGSVSRLLQTRPDSKFTCRTEFYDIPAVIPMSFDELIKYQPKQIEEIKK